MFFVDFNADFNGELIHVKTNISKNELIVYHFYLTKPLKKCQDNKNSIVKNIWHVFKGFFFVNVRYSLLHFKYNLSL